MDEDDDEVDSEEDDPEPAANQAALTSAAMRSGNLNEEVARIATTRWGLVKRNYFSRPDTRVTCASFHPGSALLVAGFSDGVFGLWTMPSFDSIHTLSISNTNISSVSLDPTGEWLAFGASGLGQLLVWEWQSESYILKQQGHYFDMNAVAYTAVGSIAATGGDDGRVKLWNVESGFCIATFQEHSAPVTALEFSKGGAGVLFSASLDGTVRAWDLLRYRNFRTFTSPSPCQFGSLAVEANGEIICAGGTADSFDVYLWNVQTGKLLDVLSGHEGPVSSMMFSPNGSGMLATTGWDRSFRVWEIFRRTATVEPVTLNAEGLALAFRPDGLEICIATFDGQLAFFDSRTSKQTAVIECRRDIAGGRAVDDKVSRNANAGGTAFTTLSYTADGSAILAGGNANFICLYSIAERVLLNRWQLSLDLTLDGTQDRLDSRRLTEAGAAELLDVFQNEDEMTPQERIDRSLPGAQSGDMAKRTTRRKARTKAIRFNPTGRSFAAATTLGLLVYSLDAPGLLAEDSFDPLELEIELTPEAVRSAMKKGDALLALLGALRLNEGPLLAEVYEQVPINEAPLILSRLPTPKAYIPPLMRLIASRLRPVSSSSSTSSSKPINGLSSTSSSTATRTTSTPSGSPHLEFSLLFLSHLLTIHGPLIQSNANVGEYATACRAVGAALAELRRGVKRLGDDAGAGAIWTWEALQRKEKGPRGTRAGPVEQGVGSVR
jgi:periodic tryptophan protein 2